MCYLMLIHLVYISIFYPQQPLFVDCGGGGLLWKKYLLKFAKARLTTLPQNIGGETRKSTFVRNFLLLCEVLTN